MGKWSNHPTGNDSVQDKIIEVHEECIFHVMTNHFINKTFEEMGIKAGETIPEELEIAIDMAIKRKLEEYEEHLYAREESYNEILRELMNNDEDMCPCCTTELVKDVIIQMVERDALSIIESEDDWMCVDECIDVCENMIATLFAVLELRHDFEDDEFLDVLFDGLDIVADIYNHYTEQLGKVEEAKVISEFYKNKKTILEEYLLDDNTFMIVRGLDVFEVAMVKNGRVNIPAMKKDLPLFDLLGLDV